MAKDLTDTQVVTSPNHAFRFKQYYTFILK